MKRIVGTFFLVAALLAVGSSTGLASETGYCYIVAYSYQQRVAYVTPVFTAEVNGDSYSSTEFTADVPLIQKMESSFENFVHDKIGFTSPDLTVSARAAYKTMAIARDRMEKEVKEFSGRGLKVSKADDFRLGR